MYKTVVVLGLFLTATPARAQLTPEEARPVISRALGAILQADGPTARDLLLGLQPEVLNERQTDMRTCVLERLTPTVAESAMAEDAPFAFKALEAYRTYWRDAVMKVSTREAAEAALVTRLASLLGQSPAGGMDVLGPLVFERIRAEGYYTLGHGRTGVLLDMVFWSRQDERLVTVALPEGEHEARVFLLDDFPTRGWSHWMSCGRTGTGAWAKPEGLYAIVPAYPSLENENFRINFLAHETQHLADYRTFPGLQSWELEYRAKLTEVILAETTRETVLDAFNRNQGDDPADSHSYANRRIVAALRGRLNLPPDADLKSVVAEVLREAAREELFADTARRHAAEGAPAS